MKQNQGTIIESIGVYLPPKQVSTREVMEGCRNPINFPLEKITGIRTRHIAGETEFSIDLARKAVEKCLTGSKYSATEIDIIICCNISRYDGPRLVSFEPCTSVKLKDDLGFRNAIAFDVANACAGMFTGINVLDALIRTGAVRRGMVVSGEYISHLTKSAQQTIENFLDSRLACLTLGDAGVAMILEGTADPLYGFREIDMRTFGGYSHYCIAKMTPEDGIIMFTDSVNMTEVGIRSCARNALEIMERAQWPADSFQQLIMHQTSAMTLNSARGEINRLLGSRICHEGNTVNNLAERGNTASTAHFVALSDSIHSGKINKGDRVVFSITASGLTIGTALYVVDDLPGRMQGVKEKVTGESDSNANRPGEFHRLRVNSVGVYDGRSTGKEGSLGLLELAASECLKRSDYDASEIGLLIYTGVYRDEFVMEPAYASLLAGALNMNPTTSSTQTKTLAFDIFNGSVGFLNACYVAQQMIAAKKSSTAMVVASESENNKHSFPGELLNISETSSAVILDTDPANEKGFSGFLFRYAEGSTDAYRTYSIGDTNPHLIIRRSEELDNMYIECIVAAVYSLLERERIELSAIDKIFPPQISTAFILKLANALHLPIDRFVNAVEEGKDLFSSSIPYAFHYANENGLVKEGDLGLVIAVGSGVQAGVAIYHF